MLILKKAIKSVFFLFLLTCAPTSIYSDNSPLSHVYAKKDNGGFENEKVKGKINHNNVKEKKVCKRHSNMSYYLFINDFINSFIEIPTANVSADSTTISSLYLAGRAPIYNKKKQTSRKLLRFIFMHAKCKRNIHRYFKLFIS